MFLSVQRFPVALLGVVRADMDDAVVLLAGHFLVDSIPGLLDG